MKKLLVIIMALALVMGMAGAAFAAPVTDGTITIDGNGYDITGRTFDAYQLFTVTDTYTIGTPPVTHYNYEATDLLKAAVDSLNTGAALTLNQEYVEWVADNVNTTAEKETFANAITALLGSYSRTAELFGDGTTTNTVTVPFGYYIVVETTEDLEALFPDYKNVTPMIFALDTAENLVIYLKADFYDFNKTEVDETGLKIDSPDGYKIGDTVYFTLDTIYPTITDLTTQAMHWFSDTMDAGLAYNNDLTLSIGGAAVTIPSTGVVLDGVTGSTADFDLVIDYLLLSGFNPGDKVVLSYSATVTNDALVVGLENNATLKFSNDPTSEGLNDKVTVYTYGFDILKVNPEGNALADAIFELSQGTNGAAFNFVLKDGVYYYSPAAVTGSITELKSDEDGKIKIWGLDAGAYILTETVAPKGFNLLPDPLNVVIRADGAGAYTVYFEDDDAPTAGAHQIKVTNVSGVELPSAGGMGTAIFTIAGIAVTAGAAFVLMMSRKRIFN